MCEIKGEEMKKTLIALTEKQAKALELVDIIYKTKQLLRIKIGRYIFTIEKRLR